MLAAPPAETPAIDRTACPADRHGTASAAQNHRCRCADATRALKQRRATGAGDPYVDATGTVRRRQALLAMGFSFDDMAAVVGVSAHTMKCLNSHGRDAGRTRRSTADRMRRAFDALASLPLPQTSGAVRRRAQVAPLGYALPWEWVDIDDPADRPDAHYRRTRRHSTNPGRGRIAEAVIAAIRDEYRAAGPRGFNPDDVCARHGVSKPTVSRAIHGAIGGETSDLVAELGRKFAPADRPAALERVTDAQIRAVRADYLAGVPWSQLGPRHGVSDTLAGRIVHGRIRPRLALTDLTTAPRSGGAPSQAASPAGCNESGKESAA